MVTFISYPTGETKSLSWLQMLKPAETDDLRTGFKVAKWGAFCHPLRLGNHPARLKLVSSDRAL